MMWIRYWVLTIRSTANPTSILKKYNKNYLKNLSSQNNYWQHINYAVNTLTTLFVQTLWLELLACLQFTQVSTRNCPRILEFWIVTWTLSRCDKNLEFNSFYSFSFSKAKEDFSDCRMLIQFLSIIHSSSTRLV